MLLDGLTERMLDNVRVNSHFVFGKTMFVAVFRNERIGGKIS